jgi:hypothetical protein
MQAIITLMKNVMEVYGGYVGIPCHDVVSEKTLSIYNGFPYAQN